VYYFFDLYNIYIIHFNNIKKIETKVLKFYKYIIIIKPNINIKMNLFILSLNFKECAQFMFDKHISKIILEAVQMLCTAIQIVDPDNEISSKIQLYKIAHKNHPVTIWMRTSLENYMWTLDLIEEMHNEWKYRYNHPPEKMHKSYIVSQYLREYAPLENKFPTIGLTPFALAMPVECKCEDPIESYRIYYQTPEKQKIASWKRREKPSWYQINK